MMYFLPFIFLFCFIPFKKCDPHQPLRPTCPFDYAPLSLRDLQLFSAINDINVKEFSYKYDVIASNTSDYFLKLKMLSLREDVYYNPHVKRKFRKGIKNK